MIQFKLKHRESVLISFNLFFIFVTALFGATNQLNSHRGLTSTNNKFTQINASLLASTGILKKIDRFSTQDIEVMNEEFNNSLNKPTVAMANAFIAQGYNDYTFSFQKSYYSLLEVQNPVFPQVKITQYNDSKLGLTKKIVQNNFTLTPEILWIERKYQSKTYKLEQLLEEEIEFDPNAGIPFQFFRFNLTLTNQLTKNLLLIASVKNIDLQDSPLKQNGHTLAAELLAYETNKKYVPSIYFSTQTTKEINWENFIILRNSYYELELSYNSYSDINRRIALLYKSLSFEYLRKNLRDQFTQNFTTPIEGVTLNFKKFY